LKLILSVEALASELTGIGRYTWELAQRMPTHSAVSGVQFYRNGQWVSEPASLLGNNSVQSNRSIGLRFKSPRWLRSLSMRLACRDAVFHGPNYFLPPCADKGVITVHDLSVFKFPQTHPTERVKQFERDFSRSLAQAMHVITDTNATRSELIAFAGLPANRVSAVPLGVAGDFVPRSIQHTKVPLEHYGLVPGGYALCVCTLEPRKKIDQLLLAWQYLPMAVRQAYPMVLVGGYGWLSDALHAQIAQAQAQGWVKHLGYVPENHLPLLYAGARLFVYPSTYEGFGLPAIEAMACGVPVVVSNQSCMPEVTQGAALMVDPDDTTAFAATLEQGLTDNVWRASAVAAGLVVASAYTWQRCVDETVAVYGKV
jgi:glycosyltransferase involved in cell wall biosynthesis